MAILIVIVITFLVIGFIFYKNRTVTVEMEKELKHKDAEISKLHVSEENLRHELTSLETRLQHAIEDPLTKLLGWTLFEDRVNQNIQESARYQFTMGILYIDINDFKVINEALGYEVGDAVLNEVSRRLQHSIRQMDSVSRLSKDIFVVLLTQLGKPETAAIVSQRILEAIAQPIQVNEHKLYITVSIGISIYPVDGIDASILFRNADQALLIAKEKGNNTYQFYQEKESANSLRELEISSGLRRDTFFNECEIYYQPIMHAQEKTIFCMEALLYWRHPDLGLVHADELFNYIEKHDKSNAACEWLLKKSCQQFIAWQNIGLRPELLGISISIRQLRNIQFIYRISQILQECDFKPEWLMLVIEENITQTSFESVEKGFNMLEYLNIKLAVNHFGAGIFSIQDLKKFSVNYLKLDQSLVTDLEVNEKTIEFIHAICILAQSLSMKLIIQGVDTEKQMMILSGLGCDLIQGRFVGEPRPEKQVEELA